MSAQLSPQPPSHRLEQSPKSSQPASVSARIRFAGWTTALCLLTIGPGSLEYGRCVTIAECVIAVIFLLSIASSSRRRTKLDWLALAWIASQALSTLWSYIAGWGTHSPYPAELYNGGLFGPLRLFADTVVAVLGFFAATSGTDRSDADPNGLRPVAPLLIAAAGVAVLCAIEAGRNSLLGTDDPRIQATFTNPNLLGAFLCLALPVSSGTVLAPGLSRTARIGLAVLTGCLGAALILTQSRGAVLGCAVGLCYLGAAIWVSRGDNHLERARRGRGAIKLIAVSCIALVSCGLLLFPRVSRLSHAASDGQRRVAWQGAVLIIRAHPITGLGVGSYPAALGALRLKEVNPDSPSGLPMLPAMHLHAHNLLLEAWVERGLPGAATVTALILLVLLKAIRVVKAVSGERMHPIAIGAIAALLATLAQNVSDYTLWYAPVTIAFWYVLGLMFAPQQSNNPVSDHSGRAADH